LTSELIPEFIITIVNIKDGAQAVKNYRSAELARLTGVSPDTLRFYERRGLLPKPPRLSNNYREYPASALSRVHLIRAALSLGFSTQELVFILRERDAGRPPCKSVRDLAEQKLQQLNQEIQNLQTQRARLREILRDWDERLRHDSNEPAKLLESVKSVHKAK
jgi:DNA-binding transcriptional MerR regulator